MEPSAFALAELKKKLIPLDRRLVDSRREVIKERGAVISAACQEAGCLPVEGEDDPNYKMEFSPRRGVRIVISTGISAMCHKSHFRWKSAIKLEASLCNARCQLVELMTTEMLRKFRLFCIEAYGKEPTEKKIAASFADWMMLQQPHVCPVG